MSTPVSILGYLTDCMYSTVCNYSCKAVDWLKCGLVKPQIFISVQKLLDKQATHQ